LFQHKSNKPLLHEPSLKGPNMPNHYLLLEYDGSATQDAISRAYDGSRESKIKLMELKTNRDANEKYEQDEEENRSDEVGSSSGKNMEMNEGELGEGNGNGNRGKVDKITLKRARTMMTRMTTIKVQKRALLLRQVINRMKMN